ncbi:MAG: hypothetical protein Q8934_08810 [Bacillota bacterium]|nr:hypothetical protein [Bacillota bacterium]
MKRYSRFDLLNNAIVGSTGQVINRIFESKEVKLTISVPEYDLKRASVFVGTINELIEDEVDELFTIEDLIVLLYKDLLRQIDIGMNLDTFARAIESKLNDFEKTNVKVHHYLKNLEENISLDEIRQQMKQKKQVQNQEVYFSFRILKKYVLKGEVLLHDLNELYPKIHLNVEELIALRFKDIMREIKAGDYKILANIIQTLTNS